MITEDNLSTFDTIKAQRSRLQCAIALINSGLIFKPTFTTCNVYMNLVRTKPQKFSSEYALSNGFGFGGVNASIILKRWAQ